MSKLVIYEGNYTRPQALARAAHLRKTVWFKPLVWVRCDAKHPGRFDVCYAEVR